MLSFLRELWRFLRARKKYWMVPIFLMLAIFGGLLAVVEGTAVAPLIYTIF